MLDDSHRDYTYFREQGWLKSDYYYKARLGPLKKTAGSLFDLIGAGMSKARGDQHSGKTDLTV